jgi:acyl carrier protein
MSNKFEPEELFQTITRALLSASSTTKLSSSVGPLSQMGDPKEWDSLSFVGVFLTVTQEFGVEADDDDAIHFMSVERISQFLNDVL